MSTRALFLSILWQWNITKIRGRHVRLGNIGASAHTMAAFSGIFESHKPHQSGDTCGILPAHRHSHRNGRQRWHILHHCFVCCRPGSRRGDTERVVARWQRLVAFMKALDLLYQAMCSVLLQCVCVAIEMAQDGGTFVRRRHLFWLL